MQRQDARVICSRCLPCWRCTHTQLSEVGEREAQLRVSLASSVERERMAQERAAAAAAEAARARGESERRRDELQGTQGRLVDATSQLLEAEMELAQLRAQVRPALVGDEA